MTATITTTLRINDYYRIFPFDGKYIVEFTQTKVYGWTEVATYKTERGAMNYIVRETCKIAEAALAQWMEGFAVTVFDQQRQQARDEAERRCQEEQKMMRVIMYEEDGRDIWYIGTYENFRDQHPDIGCNVFYTFHPEDYPQPEQQQEALECPRCENLVSSLQDDLCKTCQEELANQARWVQQQEEEEHPYLNDWIELDNHIYVHRYNILGTSHIESDVWEPGQLMGTHSTITHHEKFGWLGKLTMRELPPELEALPGWKPGFWPEERIRAVQAWRDDLEQQAQQFIKQAFLVERGEK